ncbi:hypothetical protein CVT26_009710 [Gymnopilus dilepis]|uniref:Uncharacterized protein n=1 Tax=Gymnopilus dilepis TaxID=231916 RepID=A0A409WCN5_9AGAR|nr:hypothetical protein CVT26_009710 [Gymnopilus dilepis]
MVVLRKDAKLWVISGSNQRYGTCVTSISAPRPFDRPYWLKCWMLTSPIAFPVDCGIRRFETLIAEIAVLRTNTTPLERGRGAAGLTD